MTFDDYLLHLFYLIDCELEAMNLPRLRRRGPAPLLHDSEVITIELAGEFLGLDADTGIYAHFCRYHRGEFPRLPQVDRTTFARQSANLWHVRQLLNERLAARLPPADEIEPDEPLWLLDSFPLRVCRVVRAELSKLFRGVAAFGRDPALAGRHCFYGFRVHLRISDAGAVAQMQLAPANVADVLLARELAPPGGGIGVADRNYWSPQHQRWLGEQAGFALLAAFKQKSRDPRPALSQLLGHVRQPAEVVIAQLAQHFNAERTRARDLWHLCARLARKLLAHTTAVLLNWRAGNPPLRLELLLSG
jgi:hypothetical protein